MKDLSKVTIDLKNGKIIFNGDCSEVRDVCEAMCCRKAWDVFITDEEFQSQLYKAKTMCSITRKDCNNEKISCINRMYLLEKKKDDSCIYLDDQDKCSIHEYKPQVCRNFICKEWTIVPFVDQNDKSKGRERIDEFWKKYFMEKLKPDMKFILNPITKSITLFYSKKRREIVFVERIVTRCTPVTSRCSYFNPAMDDNRLLYLLKLFDGENILENVLQRFNEKYKLDLSKEDFYEIVWLLNTRNIIIFKSQGGRHPDGE